MGKRKERQIVQDEKYDKEEGESSGDEMPEMVSNAAMKLSYELQTKQLADAKQQLRQTEKEKRRRKQESYLAQKKTKISEKSEMPGNKIDINETGTTTVLDESSKTERSGNVKPMKKVYPSLNISVQPLAKVQDRRAGLAVDFKSKRLAKVPRESVSTAVISYQKKLRVRK